MLWNKLPLNITYANVATSASKCRKRSGLESDVFSAALYMIRTAPIATPLDLLDFVRTILP